MTPNQLDSFTHAGKAKPWLLPHFDRIKTRSLVSYSETYVFYGALQDYLAVFHPGVADDVVKTFLCYAVETKGDILRKAVLNIFMRKNDMNIL